MLIEFDIPEIVLKRGGGPLDIYRRPAWKRLPLTFMDSVVDATAAGDSFNAAYLAARWRNRSPIEAAIGAHKLASTVISHSGAIIPLSAMP